MTPTLTFMIANQHFHIVLWHMMVHHHTKSGYRRLSTSENILQTKTDRNVQPSLEKVTLTLKTEIQS